MATEIRANTDVTTVINVFGTTPETQPQLLEHLRTGTEALALARPGFVSANFHGSTDGLRVVI